MNTYEIRVNNAVIKAQGIGEYAAIKNLCLFGDQPQMVEAVKIPDEDRPEYSWGWIYQVEVNKRITLAYIKRIG